MDGRTDDYFSVWRGYISEVTCHRRLHKKKHPQIWTAQVEKIGGKINYRATFTYHITRQDQDGEKSSLRKNAARLYKSLSAIYMPTYRRCFFFRVK